MSILGSCLPLFSTYEHWDNIEKIDKNNQLTDVFYGERPPLCGYWRKMINFVEIV